MLWVNEKGDTTFCRKFIGGGINVIPKMTPPSLSKKLQVSNGLLRK